MIEVNELVVRATVVENGRESDRVNPGSTGVGSGNCGMSEEEKAALIEDCIRQVRRIRER